MPGKPVTAQVILDDIRDKHAEAGSPSTFSGVLYESMGGYSRSTVQKYCGSSDAGALIGLNPNPQTRRSQGSARDWSNMERHVAKLYERIRKLEGGNSHRPVKSKPNTVIAIGDLHMPWHSPRWLTKVYELIRQVKPSHIVQLGDAMDQFSHSRFASTRNIMTPSCELGVARQELEVFWATIRKIVPQATCTQLLGNHDDRMFSRLIESVPSMESVVAGHLLDLYRFPGVELVESSRDRLELDGVIYMHGTGKLGTHCRALSQNVVRGHDHQPGLVTQRVGDRVFWEASAGHCADPEAPVFGYVKHSRYAKLARALLKIERGQPHFYYDLEDQE